MQHVIYTEVDSVDPTTLIPCVLQKLPNEGKDATLQERVNDSLTEFLKKRTSGHSRGGKRFRVEPESKEEDEEVVLIDESKDEDLAVAVEIDSGGLRSVGSVGSVSLVELGKKLLMGAKDGDTEQVRNLMSKGAPFTTDWLGTSPLHLAAQSGHYDTTEVLLRAGISRDSRTKVERTPLHLAACDGHTEIVQLLLAAGADIDALDMLKMTPLHWAVERGQVDTVQLLLQNGANPRLVNKFDKTPFTIALDNNRHDILQLLQNTDATTTVSGDERTSIHDMEATLAATESISAEKSQVPTPSQQEEVETCKNTN
uniref:Uncharacterized protein n=1 Tax=Timema douglasi TaxID=61478 RepID=A0A7R8VPG0_TIMDO|nr:unnamed protein product [Timema douglasi]